MSETATPKVGTKTACLLVIGNEILSGRTQDANIRAVAVALGAAGIRLDEVRVIPDVAETIISTLNTCRAHFDMVLTTGGIGPTHDDITAPCVARAFGVPLERHDETFRLLEATFAPGTFNTARQRMAMLPKGSIPIPNDVSAAPGFSIGNVHVMAGVPRIMRAMLRSLVPTLPGGAPLAMASWHSDTLREGDLADALSAVQDEFPALDLGSYPYERPDGRRGVALVAKGFDSEQVRRAGARLRTVIEGLGAVPIEGEPPA
ncbi:competence/damage-inducible protein A [Tanticharoenia sakaeratensis]|uniref:MoaB/Mog domain-containing protein n=1 Tax=Tanticharoenia sakaeratensis NBRC 103193 TaxID=1231623 RepID=A0A0D6MLV8_9PROT|nr:molybdopterin-binding protein [Tanticharoenia sakaeratensis]GAN54248.1 hypothetical protein Tasa_017_131 [Tanticharoenia sakaeratensis NBRC 103193]GBQ19165.1 competence-damage protein [Tanticharoenia sakaeratensis NBRC 103193]